MKKSKLFLSAKKLRKEGYSLREISEKLNISKSTASNWLSEIKFSSKGKERFDKLILKSREKSKKIKKKQKK